MPDKSKFASKFVVGDLVIDDQYGVIDSTASVVDAAKKMKELGVPDLVVVDPTSKKVLGAVADFDIVQNVVAEGRDPKTEQVTGAMYTITPVTRDTPVEEAFARLRDLNVNVVPVVENDTLLGVCSIQDCWSYIPDQNPDEIGLIPVKNSKNAEFWFTAIVGILGFLFGVIFPLSGLFGFYKMSAGNLASFLGISGDFRGTNVDFFLFEAHGQDFIISYTDIVDRVGFLWVLVIICAFGIVIFGLLGLFTLFYTSYSEMRRIRTNRYLVIVPWIYIGFVVLEWILMIIAFSTASNSIVVQVDGVGLTLSIFSILFFVGALFRNYVFRQVSEPSAQVSS